MVFLTIFLILNFGTKFANYLWRHNVHQDCQTATKKCRISQARILPSFMPFGEFFTSLWPMWEEKHLFLTIVMQFLDLMLAQKIIFYRFWFVQKVMNYSSKVMTDGPPRCISLELQHPSKRKARDKNWIILNCFFCVQSPDKRWSQGGTALFTLYGMCFPKSSFDINCNVGVTSPDCSTQKLLDICNAYH